MSGGHFGTILALGSLAPSSRMLVQATEQAVPSAALPQPGQA